MALLPATLEYNALYPEAVLKLLEQLTRSEAIDAEQAQHMRSAAYQQHLRQHPKTATELKEWFRRLPESDKHHAQLTRIVATSFNEQNEPLLARDVLEQTLAVEWDSDLAECYGEVVLSGDALTAQLQQAETWLKQHPHDHRLLLTLGRLCRQRELWGKAQTYFEASIAIHPTAIAHAELARLLDTLEREEESNHHYRASLALALH